MTLWRNEAMKKFASILALCLSLLAAAAPPENPWPLVPALPSACFGEQDRFLESVATGIAALDERISAQQTINDQVSSQVGNMAAADPFELAQRMQEYLMNNPQAATKMMEDLYASGQTMAEDAAAENERAQELTAAIDGHIARYRSAFATMRTPIDAKIAALPTEETEAGPMLTNESIARLPAFSAEANTAYQQLCATWWQPGPFAALLAEFRKFLTDDKVPREDKTFDQGKQQWAIQGVDTSEVRSTAAMDAARSYLQQLQKVYTERLDKPFDFGVVAGG
jgi:hypothetical protein